MGIVTIDCADRVGLVSETAGILFDLGANMEDTVFRVFGDQAKLTAVCDFPSDLSLDELQFSLIEQLGLGNEEVNVAPYTGPTLENPSESITHRIIVSGGDRPGLIARLSEVFVQFRANIVRLNAEKSSDDENATYRIRIDLSISPKNERACLATIANTAGELGLNCAWESV
ncbi:MAG: amino acid-binding protein [Rhodospirillaceae bacterium]|nr:amino acid-binding protein [Rhodospirillales bacterium]MBT3904025.1 amino acid-binding protein [Rhodospirillaceae bacterium]MBT4702954.1 amino acid-binding protein [Rhodospirillaceae bacterium]MBT5036514.1 amino acid-binding protein [Rhodospirillaceae bacterium]MBT6218239.1 amino acid-binding protein [Rhodospirillaceae bacterium]